MGKRLITAIGYTMLTSATIHMVILFILAIRDQSLTYINYFAILNLNAFFPGIHQGMVSDLASLGIVIALITFWYTRQR